MCLTLYDHLRCSRPGEDSGDLCSPLSDDPRDTEVRTDTPDQFSVSLNPGPSYPDSPPKPNPGFPPHHSRPLLSSRTGKPSGGTPRWCGVARDLRRIRCVLHEDVGCLRLGLTPPVKVGELPTGEKESSAWSLPPFRPRRVGCVGPTGRSGVFLGLQVLGPPRLFEPDLWTRTPAMRTEEG